MPDPKNPPKPEPPPEPPPDYDRGTFGDRSIEKMERLDPWPDPPSPPPETGKDGGGHSSDRR